METKTLVKWMSFILFKLCNGKEKAKFRKLERAYTRLASAISHLRCKETCFKAYTCVFHKLYYEDSGLLELKQKSHVKHIWNFLVQIKLLLSTIVLDNSLL